MAPNTDVAGTKLQAETFLKHCGCFQPLSSAGRSQAVVAHNMEVCDAPDRYTWCATSLSWLPNLTHNASMLITLSQMRSNMLAVNNCTADQAAGKAMSEACGREPEGCATIALDIGHAIVSVCIGPRAEGLLLG